LASGDCSHRRRAKTSTASRCRPPRGGEDEDEDDTPPHVFFSKQRETVNWATSGGLGRRGGDAGLCFGYGCWAGAGQVTLSSSLFSIFCFLIWF
jgi:hypothetical protein